MLTRLQGSHEKGITRCQDREQHVKQAEQERNEQAIIQEVYRRSSYSYIFSQLYESNTSSLVLAWSILISDSCAGILVSDCCADVLVSDCCAGWPDPKS